MAENVKEAVLWQSLDNDVVLCNLCSFHCRIKPGQKGICSVRENRDGKLYSLNYNSVCSAAVDPIEKKPIFHYYPGHRSFSISCVGCNFQCDFCQNWQISQQPRRGDGIPINGYSPKEIVDAAVQSRCYSISYTYTEPTIFMELAADCGRLAKEKGLDNIFVSNGFMSIDAVDYARDFLDAINVDLKSMSHKFYRNICKAELDPVLDTLRYIAKQTDIWLEVTTLLVPGENDSDHELKKIADFIAQELGDHVPWHISRFHPNYERRNCAPTPVERMEKAYEFGKRAGLWYVYLGNAPDQGKGHTYCHQCDHLLIERFGFDICQYNIIAGKCPGCGSLVTGRKMDIFGDV
ncbi:MAG: AmmeMemoRadiSam system radical SAM enzyme [Phycisphaerae bacterium]|nr:AmmeMemoRadiSam system radical SAM enzyme [Phycisphaerae bacterium]